ncbi:MAG: hypothetical protein WBO45_07990 [Planctomycetota bacterium]
MEARFAGLSVAPGPRVVDWPALRGAAADLPFRFAAVRVSNPLAETSATAGLGSAKDSERRLAVHAIHQAVALARVVECPVVVVDPGVVPVVGEIEAEDLGDPHYDWTPARVDPLRARVAVGRNGALDRVCRELFAVVRAHPDITFCLTQGRSLRSLAEPRALLDLFEDLGNLRLQYWHDAALSARWQQVAGLAQGEWLETFSNRLRGMTLGDASADGLYLPPGAGGVDYALLASYVPRTGQPLPVVVELDVAIPPADLPGVRSCLDKYGL